MPKINLKVPKTPLVANAGTSDDYSKPDVMSANKKTIASIRSNYGAIINNIGAIANVDPRIMISKIAVESTGKNLPRNSAGYMGLVQTNEATTYDVLKKEVSDGLLSDSELAIIKKYIPSFGISKNWLGKSTIKQSYSQIRPSLTTALMKPEFSILVGSIFMGQLFDKFTNSKTNEVDLHRAFAAYNWGQNRTLLKNEGLDTTALVKALPSRETSEHVKKLLGSYGFLDLIINRGA
jgi:hypothetical protein